MTISNHFNCSKDEFYVKLINSAQGFQKKKLGWAVTLRVVEEKHEFGTATIAIFYKEFGVAEYPVGDAHCAYFEENGGTTCNATINLPLSFKLYQGRIKGVFEDMFEKINNM